MPPRRKTSGGPGTKRGVRVTRAASKVQPHPPDEALKVEQVKEEAEEKAMEELREEVKLEEKAPVAEQKSTPARVKEEPDSRRVECGSLAYKKEYEQKESVDEYEKGERLDLEDNDPEYETEEYGGPDYDDKGIEHEDVQEEGEEIEEHEEEYIGDEGEGDMVEEEVEDVNEDLEGEEDDEQVGEEHGQMVDDAEEDEHHEVVKERRKRKEFEIFIGGLDKDATEDDLRKVFSKVGDVTEVRLMMNPQTKKNKGFAFLRFATVEQAKRACTELKNPVVNGKQCGVTPSQDSDTLFLGNICKTWTEEALKEKLKHYGVDNIYDLTLVEDTNNVGMNRGFAFLEFSSRSDAMDAFKRLQKRDVVFGVDRPAKVSFADSFIDPGDEIMAQVKTVFIDGLSAYWDEARINELLKKYGKIEKIELARNMPSAKRKDFGFVTFDSHDAAVSCAKCINNAVLGDGDIKVKVRARLSRPLSRGRGKYGSRGDVRPGRGPVRAPRAPWGRPVSHNLSVRGTRVGTRVPPLVDRNFKRPAGYRDRRPVIAPPPRARPVAPVPSRSYERRPPAPAYSRNSSKRDYGSRAAIDYAPRVPSDRRTSYRDEYSSHGSGYPDFPGGTSRTAVRRAYVDDGYEQRFERPPPVYRESRAREYDSISGSKRAYTALDDVPPQYVEAGVRRSRARLEYDFGGRSASQYGDAYGDRPGRPNLGYSSSRSSMASQDSHGLYSSRQGMGYDRGSYGGSDVGGVYTSGYSGDYISHGSDMGGSSYSSIYSNRDLGGGGYMRSGGSRSYY
ncbi:PREDICTED: nucleolin-like isoform X2 [Ipomoea nil]|uniref:nucleolin-like isoform X2 n=1 Tax=Ipomoea nil TaxID=35883 RepID=UPI000900B361|nr:PREDICTED: nucleolin-like isoform X2 [Ipomoea nil]